MITASLVRPSRNSQGTHARVFTKHCAGECRCVAMADKSLSPFKPQLSASCGSPSVDRVSKKL